MVDYQLLSTQSPHYPMIPLRWTTPDQLPADYDSISAGLIRDRSFARVLLNKLQEKHFKNVLKLYFCCFLPLRNKCSRSHAGTFTKPESVSLIHPRTSNKRNLVEFFSIRSIPSSSTQRAVVVLSSSIPASDNSSRQGNPGDAT